MKAIHVRSNPVRQLSDALSIKYVHPCSEIPLGRFETLCARMQEMDDGEYLFLNDFTPYQPRQSFSVYSGMGCQLQSCCWQTPLHGNDLGTLHFVWKLIQTRESHWRELSRYCRLWLFSACAYKQLRLQETMRLTDNVRLTSGIIVATPSMRKHVITKRVIVNKRQEQEKLTSTPVSDDSIFLHESVIWGHHNFKGIWTPRTGEIVQVRQEAGNPHDRNAVALFKADGTVIGHVPSSFLFGSLGQQSLLGP